MNEKIAMTPTASGKTSATVNGTAYSAAFGKRVFVDIEHVATLLSHGFEIAETEIITGAEDVVHSGEKHARK